MGEGGRAGYGHARAMTPTHTPKAAARPTRRALLAAPLLAALARPALGQGTAGAARVLRFIPRSDVAVLDPIATTAHVTRNHAFLVWDTLYGLDADAAPQPQMAEGHVAEEEGRRILIRLRQGLLFHDGEPVRARDAVASIRRWARRASLGQALMAATEELSAADDRTIVFRLKRPFPRLFEALASPSPPACFVMPERLARTDPGTPIRGELVGSGPFRFVAGERAAGSRLVYARFEGYQPRAEGEASWTAGPKRAHLDRVEWLVTPEPAAAAAALRAGEADWWEEPTAEALAALRRDRNIVQESLDPTGVLALARFNALHPPFDKAPVRRALLAAIRQGEFMEAVIGADRSLWRDEVGVFPPGSPMASDEGLDVMEGRRDFDRIRRGVTEAGYAGEKVVVLGIADVPPLAALSRVGAETLRRAGLEVEALSLPWAEVVARRTRREPPADGGWSISFATLAGLDAFHPGVHPGLRGNGADGWFGWPTLPRLEAMREAWLEAAELPAQQRIARDIQRAALEEAPFLPLGQYFQGTAYRRGLTGMPKGLPAFWNVQRVNG